MVIGSKKFDDVELLYGKFVPAERLELGGKVSLFDFSHSNQKQLQEWEELGLIMVEPNNFNWDAHTKRERSALLIEVETYLKKFKS